VSDSLRLAHALGQGELDWSRLAVSVEALERCVRVELRNVAQLLKAMLGFRLGGENVRFVHPLHVEVVFARRPGNQCDRKLDNSTAFHGFKKEHIHLSCIDNSGLLNKKRINFKQKHLV
jgi:hypothetical protein